jgi:hypothetical protein
MPKQIVSVEVESSGYQLMESLAAVVKAAKAGGASAALTAAVAQVVGVVADIEALPADAKEDMGELLKGAVIGAADVVEAALGVS